MSDATDPTKETGDVAELTGDALLSVRDLEKHYPIREGLLRRQTGRVRAVDGVDFDLRRGEAFGLVGESGCGKSTAVRTALSLESPTAGRVRFDGRNVAAFSRSERKRFRRRVQMVFQDPTSSFDPRMTVGESVAEPMGAHGLAAGERRTERVASLLELVDLSPDDRDRYPHELSGGQLQRAALARALSVNPDVLVLDEPVSALDVSVQAEILALVSELREAFDLAVLLISHDMSVVRQLCDRVAVMYLGEIVERGPTDALFDDPGHPYTRALLSAIPEPNPHDRLEGGSLAGDVPDPAAPPSGCRFHTRCPAVIPPDDVDVPQSAYRAIRALRADLRSGDFDTDPVRERLAADGSDETAPRSRLRDRVRAEYDIPPELDCETAERAVSGALSAAVEGAVETAARRLDETFSSVCERERPEPHGSGARVAACHRRSSDWPDDPADGETTR